MDQRRGGGGDGLEEGRGGDGLEEGRGGGGGLVWNPKDCVTNIGPNQ